MHYKNGEAGLPAVAELEAFISLFPAQEVRYLDEPILRIDRDSACHPNHTIAWRRARSICNGIPCADRITFLFMKIIFLAIVSSLRMTSDPVRRIRKYCADQNAESNHNNCAGKLSLFFIALKLPSVRSAKTFQDLETKKFGVCSFQTPK